MGTPILAVVVCYNPELSALSRTIDALLEQGGEELLDILIIDNASNNVAELGALCATWERVSLHQQNANVGLGAAHNQGVKTAEEAGYSYVLLLDQDSVPMPNMVQNLLDAHIKKSNTQLVSAVGARYLNADNGSDSFFIRFGRLKFRRQYCCDQDIDNCVEADFLISSGSLISIKSLQKIGEADSTLFIDHVDTEWFLRAKSKGYKAFGVCSAVMQHGLGEHTHQVQLGRRQRNVPQHKPFRYYYIFRNSVLLYKRDYVSTLWKWNDLQRLAMIFVMFGFFKAPRLQNLRMMTKGIRHGFSGVDGKYDG